MTQPLNNLYIMFIIWRYLLKSVTWTQSFLGVKHFVDHLVWYPFCTIFVFCTQLLPVIVAHLCYWNLDFYLWRPFFSKLLRLSHVIMKHDGKSLFIRKWTCLLQGLYFEIWMICIYAVFVFLFSVVKKII